MSAARRHHPERHAEGVHRAEGVDLAAAALGAGHRRHDRVLHAARAALPPGLDLRLPHPRGRLDGGAGGRVHPRRRASATSRRRSRAGLAVDDFAPRLSFFFNLHNDFLEEIAKLRAARRLWARLMRDRFGAKNPRSMMLRTHAQTAGCSLTAQQPVNNVVAGRDPGARGRARRRAVAAHQLDGRDARAAERAAPRMVALRTQQIIAEESGVTNTADPLGGSYAIEALTDRIEAEARDYIEQIDAHGRRRPRDRARLPAEGDRRGGVSLPAAARPRREGDGRRQPLPGRREAAIDLLAHPRARSRTRRSRASRRSRRRAITARVTARLADVRAACRDGRNLMPLLIDGGEGRRHARRDLRRLSRRVRRLPRPGVDLSGTPAPPHPRRQARPRRP